MLVRTETSLDTFANDFLTYLCGGFHISNRWRIKVITCYDKTWTTTVPQPIRDQLSSNYQKEGHPVVLVYDLADSKVSEEYHRFCMQGVGFSPEQVNTHSQYDMLVIISGDHPIPQLEDPPILPPLVVIAHMTLHFIELILQRQIIREQKYTHNYDDHEATELLHMFVEDAGVEEFTKRYCLD